MPMTARAFGARRSIQSQVVIGWPVSRIGTHSGPIAFALDLFVGDRAFHHEHKRIQPSLFCLVEELHKIVANFISEYRIVQMYFRETGNRPQENIFDAGLLGAVTETLSPSQPSPAVIQRICTSETAGDL